MVNVVEPVVVSDILVPDVPFESDLTVAEVVAANVAGPIALSADTSSAALRTFVM